MAALHYVYSKILQAADSEGSLRTHVTTPLRPHIPETTAMNAMMKHVVQSRTQSRTITSRNGDTLTGSYVNVKQARDAAAILEKRREALLYLSKR